MDSEREPGDDSADEFRSDLLRATNVVISERQRKRREKTGAAYLRFKCSDIDRCNVCGEASGNMRAYVGKYQALVFIASDHAKCIEYLERHPERGRDYKRCPGKPGFFPNVCRGCPYRITVEGWLTDETSCHHPRRGSGALRAIRSKADPMDVVGCTGRSAA